MFHPINCTIMSSFAESLSITEMDERLHRTEAGMDIAFERAKTWARYSKEIMTYVEKRAHLGKY